MSMSLSSRLHVRKLVITALCTALCVVLPTAFHFIPNAGSILSPIHIPVLLCGLLCGPIFGTACGLAGPLLSSAITLMPLLAYLPPMLVECAVYGLTAGLLMRFVRTGWLYADLYISLSVSMLLGRVAAGCVHALIFSAGEYSFSVWTAAYFVTSFPGIVIHLLLIPSLIAALQAAKLIERRYPKKK